MDNRISAPRPADGISQPVFSTDFHANGSVPISPGPSGQSPVFSEKIANIDAAMIGKLSIQDLKNMLVTVHSCPSEDSKTGILPTDPVTISQRLDSLIQQEKEIMDRKRKLEDELAGIRIKENQLFEQRSALVNRLSNSLSTNLDSHPSPASSPVSSSPLVRTPPPNVLNPSPKPPPTLGPVDRDYDDDNEPAHSPPPDDETPYKTNKRPFSYTRPDMKKICPGSLPPLGPSASKKDRVDGERPLTTGVKQSRPQPMRARKRVQLVENSNNSNSNNNHNPNNGSPPKAPQREVISAKKQPQPAPTPNPKPPNPSPVTQKLPQPPTPVPATIKVKKEKVDKEKATNKSSNVVIKSEPK